MSKDHKELILNLLGMVQEDIMDLDMPPTKLKSEVIINDLYQVMRNISSWSEGMR